MQSTSDMGFFRGLWQTRKFGFGMSLNDFKAKYTGSVRNAICSFLQPVLPIGIYVLVFSVGFHSAPVKNVPYVLWLIIALVPWIYFGDILIGASNALPEYAYLVKKTCFPSQILPFIKANSAGFAHSVFSTLAVAAFILSGQTLPITAWQGYYYSFCTLILGLGIGYIAAALTPFYKDVRQILNMILQLGFWLTPIAWTQNMMSEGVRRILQLNPVFYVVQGWRDSFIGGIWFFERPLWTVYFWLFTAVVWIVAIWLFSRVKPYYADIL